MFGDKCRVKHEDRICEKRDCKVFSCELRQNFNNTMVDANSPLTVNIIIENTMMFLKIVKNLMN